MDLHQYHDSFFKPDINEDQLVNHITQYFLDLRLERQPMTLFVNQEVLRKNRMAERVFPSLLRQSRNPQEYEQLHYPFAIDQVDDFMQMRNLVIQHFFVDYPDVSVRHSSIYQDLIDGVNRLGKMRMPPHESIEDLKLINQSLHLLYSGNETLHKSTQITVLRLQKTSIYGKEIEKYVTSYSTQQKHIIRKAFELIESEQWKNIQLYFTHPNFQTPWDGTLVRSNIGFQYPRADYLAQWEGAASPLNLYRSEMIRLFSNDPSAFNYHPFYHAFT